MLSFRTQLLIISYALIELLDGQTTLCMIVFSLTALVMVGLSEIAIAMADPFGEDQADFNVSHKCTGSIPCAYPVPNPRYHRSGLSNVPRLSMLPANT